jgi:hypothetical protein
MSTAVVFFYIEITLDTSWHTGLLHKFSKLNFWTSLIKFNSSFLSRRKFRVSVEGKMYTPRVMRAGVSQGFFLSHTLFNMYVNYSPQTTWVYLAPFVEDTCLFVTTQGGLCPNKMSALAQLDGGVVHALGH